MARRASSSINPIWFIALAVLAAGAIAGGFMLKGTVADPYRTLSVFPVADYMQNSNSLRGNSYKLEAVVGDQLRFVNSARLFVVEVDGEPVSLLVPAEMREINVQKGQRLMFKVEVGDKGILKALDAKKN